MHGCFAAVLFDHAVVTYSMGQHIHFFLIPLLLEAKVGFLLNGVGGPGLKGGRSGVFFSALAGSSQ